MSHLGIDIGTTSIKVCLVRNSIQVNSVKTVHEADTKPNQLHQPHPQSHLFNEQDPRQIIQTLDSILCQLNDGIDDVTDISVTGQMHGVLLWKRKEKENISDMTMTSLFEGKVSHWTNLITWQDQRCDRLFLDSLPPSPPFCKISTGFGLATLAWLQEEYADVNSFDMCGTIMDFVTWLITDSCDVTMTSQNANSWGYFNVESVAWELEKIKQMDIDVHLLPTIVPTDHVIGKLVHPVHGITRHTNVHAALGDMQCSIRATRPRPDEAVLHIGTSSQLSFVTRYNADTTREILTAHPGVTMVPYTNNNVIITAASLSGGNVINQFVSSLLSWMQELGCANIPTKDELFRKLQHSATTYKDENQTPNHLNIIPRIYGERFASETLGSVTNISPNNCSLGSIAFSIYEGIVQNLCEILPVDLLKKYGLIGVVGTGGAFTRDGVLKSLVTDIFGLELRMGSEDEDASFGAAIFNS